MSDTEWTPLLKKLTVGLLRHHDFTYGDDRSNTAEQFKIQNWLGRPPASEDEIINLESRLGTTLSDSHRSFLRITNGWGPIDQYVWRLLPCDEIEWFRLARPDVAESWLQFARETPVEIPDDRYLVYGDMQDADDFRPEYFETALLISGDGDSAFVLLNPRTRDASGEWEAWWYAPWLPGAIRYPSFWQLLQAAAHRADQPEPPASGL